MPAQPFLLAGQMTTTDPTRSPAGTESFWAYTHVPQQVRRDAGDGGIRGTWDRDDCERFADRMQARIEEVAPGFGARVLVRRVLGPRELEARDANLVGGAHQRRHRPAAPAAGVPSGARLGPRRDPDRAGSTSAPRPPIPAAACTAPPA